MLRESDGLAVVLIVHVATDGHGCHGVVAAQHASRRNYKPNWLNDWNDLKNHPTDRERRSWPCRSLSSRRHHCRHPCQIPVYTMTSHHSTHTHTLEHNFLVRQEEVGGLCTCKNAGRSSQFVGSSFWWWWLVEEKPTTTTTTTTRLFFKVKYRREREMKRNQRRCCSIRWRRLELCEHLDRTIIGAAALSSILFFFFVYLCCCLILYLLLSYSGCHKRRTIST